MSLTARTQDFIDAIDLVAAHLRAQLVALSWLAITFQGAYAAHLLDGWIPPNSTPAKWIGLGLLLVAYKTKGKGEAQSIIESNRVSQLMACGGLGGGSIIGPDSIIGPSSERPTPVTPRSAVVLGGDPTKGGK